MKSVGYNYSTIHPVIIARFGCQNFYWFTVNTEKLTINMKRKKGIPIFIFFIPLPNVWKWCVSNGDHFKVYYHWIILPHSMHFRSSYCFFFCSCSRLPLQLLHTAYIAHIRSFHSLFLLTGPIHNLWCEEFVVCAIIKRICNIIYWFQRFNEFRAIFSRSRISIISKFLILFAHDQQNSSVLFLSCLRSPAF